MIPSSTVIISATGDNFIPASRTLLFSLCVHWALFASTQARSAFLPHVSSSSFAPLRMSSSPSSASPVHHIDTILLDASSPSTSMTLNEIDSLRQTLLLSNPSESIDLTQLEFSPLLSSSELMSSFESSTVGPSASPSSFISSSSVSPSASAAVTPSAPAKLPGHTSSKVQSVPSSTSTSAPPMISFGLAKVVRSIKDSLDGFTARFRSTSVPMNPALGEERLFYFEADSSGKIKRNKLVEVIIGPQFVKQGPPKIAACRVYGRPAAIERRLKMFKNDIKPRILSSSEMMDTLDKCNEYFADQVKLLGIPQRRRSLAGFHPSSAASAPPSSSSPSSSQPSPPPSSSLPVAAPLSSPTQSASPSSSQASLPSPAVSAQVPPTSSALTSDKNETLALGSPSSNSTVVATSTIASSMTDTSTLATESAESASTQAPASADSIDRESLEPVFPSSTASSMDESASEYETRGFFDTFTIYPGTKWCGRGDIADNYEDLGTEKKVDSCCRDHDHCPDHISPGQSKFGLNNTDSYTKSSCECDEIFYDCLQKAESFLGDQVGRMYFNVLQTPCFKKEFPIANCTDEKGFAFNTVRKACQSYKLHEDQPKVYQFFDAKFYDGKAGPLWNVLPPLVSDIINRPLAHVKSVTINGGLIGNIIG